MSGERSAIYEDLLSAIQDAYASGEQASPEQASELRSAIDKLLNMTKGAAPEANSAAEAGFTGGI